MTIRTKLNSIKYALQNYVFWHDSYKGWMKRYEDPKYKWMKSECLSFAINAAQHAGEEREELEELLGSKLNF